MSLSAGARLGPYEILSLLGKGGMGEVYRARDSRLERDVAVKVVHSGLATDRDRLARFEKEARAAAQIDHPNILVVHDVGTHDGSPFIVSELLEGASLRELLDSPLTPKKAVDIAVQIARGLAAAHEKGIVHRDIKPENVFVTKDGHVKILDFGVAKLLPSFEAPAVDPDAPTEDATQPGTTVGTVAYMSPEQIRGRPVDARTDLFSLGVVLYEMLAGRRLFRGATAAETMTAILREEPPGLAEKNPNVSPALEHVVWHCLEKEPLNRFQAARDIVFDLESLTPAPAPVPAPTPPAHRAHPLAAVALGVALLAASAAVLFMWVRTAGRTASPSFRRLTFKRGYVTGARFTPDGRTVVYSAAWDGAPSAVYSLRLDTLDSVPSGYPGANLLAISTRSQLALSLQRGLSAAFNPRGTLALSPFAGGTPRELDPDVGFADFSGDGETLAITRGPNFDMRVESPPGTVLYKSSGSYLSHVRLLPSGRYAAFLEHTGPGDRGYVVVVDRSGKTVLSKGPYSTLQGLAWAPRGDEVWFGGDPSGARTDLRAVTLGGRERVLLASPVALLPFDVSPDARVLATTFEHRFRLFCRRDGAGAERELSTLGDSAFPAISPDGAWVAFADDSLNGVYQCYLRSTGGDPPIHLGAGIPVDFAPDGKTLIVVQREGPAIVLHPVGGGQPTTIRLDGFEIAGTQRTAGLLPGGARVWFRGNLPSRPGRIWEVPVSGGKPRALTPEGPSKWVTADGAYVVSSDRGRQWISPIGGGEGRPVEGLEEGEYAAAWSADGKPLFVFRSVGSPVRVYRLDPKTGKREFFREIGPADAAGVQSVTAVITPDGRAFAYSVWQWLTELHLIDGLK